MKKNNERDKRNAYVEGETEKTDNLIQKETWEEGGKTQHLREAYPEPSGQCTKGP